MNKENKYRNPQDDAMILNEPVMALSSTQNSVSSTDLGRRFNGQSFDTDGYLKPYSLDELRQNVKLGVEDYLAGRYFTEEESDAMIDDLLHS